MAACAARGSHANNPGAAGRLHGMDEADPFAAIAIRKPTHSREKHGHEPCSTSVFGGVGLAAMRCKPTVHRTPAMNRTNYADWASEAFLM